MKFKILLIMVLMCFSIVQVNAGEITGQALKVSMVNQKPDPAEPGKYVDIRFQVGNLGDEPIEDVNIELQPSYPFSMDPGEDRLVEISSLSSMQKEDRSFVLKYQVRVDNNAVEGTNHIKIRAKAGNDEWTTHKFPVEIQTTDANLAIQSVKTQPKVAKPGKDTEVKIKIRNMADSTLKDVSMKLNLDNEEIPFAPITSGSERKINTLESGEETVFTYNLKTFPSASAGVHKIPLEIKYYDDLNKKYTKKDLIGLVVNPASDMIVFLDETSIQKAAEKGEVSLKFVNKGLSEMKFLDIEIKDTPNINILSSQRFYLGNIDSDYYEPVDFEVYVKPGAEGKVNIPVHYEYMDANNNKYTKEINIPLELYTEEEAKQLNLTEQSSGNPFVIILGIIVVLVIVYWLFRRNKQ